MYTKLCTGPLLYASLIKTPLCKPFPVRYEWVLMCTCTTCMQWVSKADCVNGNHKVMVWIIKALTLQPKRRAKAVVGSSCWTCGGFVCYSIHRRETGFSLLTCINPFSSRSLSSSQAPCIHHVGSKSNFVSGFLLLYGSECEEVKLL